MTKKTDELDNYHSDCGVFIPLPYNLAKHFPDKSHKDKSVPHITLLYAGRLTPAEYKTLIKTTRTICKNFNPFELDLVNYSELTIESGEKIGYMEPSLICKSILSRLHASLRRAAESEELKIEHTYGAKINKNVPYEVAYLPHTTLQYLEKTEVYTGAKPTGAWLVTELECWGFDTYKCQLGRNKYDSPTGLTREKLAGHYPYLTPEPIVSEQASTGDKEDKTGEMLLNRALKGWKPSIPGGLAAGSKPSEFDRRQLIMGIKVELEHTHDIAKALEIAMDHLKEDPKYYDKLKKIEKHHESETSLKGYERHAAPTGYSHSLGGVGLAGSPAFLRLMQQLEKKKKKND